MFASPQCRPIPTVSFGMGGWWQGALARFCWISCMAGVAVLPMARASAESRPLTACRFEPAGTGKVRVITDGRSFILDDGREVRLAGIEVPLPPSPGETGTRAKAGLAAHAALESIIAGQNVELRQNGVTADRYGRTPALVYVRRAGSQESVAHEMLARGFARVSAHVGERPCADELLARERAARQAKLGLWDEPYYVIVAAESGAELAAERGHFMLAEGKVWSVRESGGTIYVNFGRQWSQALTVTILKRNERMFAAASIEPKRLENRRVRVRGWVEERNGPRIEATRPEQIEIAEGN
jgi:endonuclease YncB( thermonuclease family)